jgi:hypothetical protein
MRKIEVFMDIEVSKLNLLNCLYEKIVIVYFNDIW